MYTHTYTEEIHLHQHRENQLQKNKKQTLAQHNPPGCSGIKKKKKEKVGKLALPTQ